MVRYRKRKLFVEDLPVRQIAESVGTPLYIYSRKQLLANYRAYRNAFRGLSYLICYALKANSNLSILKLLARQGSGADIVSGGELYRALKAGFAPERIVFAGVGKTAKEIETALRKRILALHVESEQELFLDRQDCKQTRPGCADQYAHQSGYQSADPSIHIHRTQETQVRYSDPAGSLRFTL